MLQCLIYSKAHVGCQIHNGEPPVDGCVGSESDLAHTYHMGFLKSGTRLPIQDLLAQL